jgi:hypothetical protein
MNASVVESIPQIDVEIAASKQAGYQSAMFYYETNRDFQHAVEASLHTRQYQTVFIFLGWLTQCYVLWKF